jgi:hypothetical protein
MLYLSVDPATSDLDDLERDPDVAAQWFADGTPVDLGLAWHGIHFLLNGSAWGGSAPLFDAVLGGTPIGDPSSYEPIRYLSPAQVSAVAEALPTAEELTPRFTHKALRQAEVYPDAAWEKADALTEFLLPSYTVLKDFFTWAASHGEAVLITLER